VINGVGSKESTSQHLFISVNSAAHSSSSFFQDCQQVSFHGFSPFTGCRRNGGNLASDSFHVHVCSSSAVLDLADSEHQVKDIHPDYHFHSLVAGPLTGRAADPTRIPEVWV
jgi:hypothetical protein